MHDPLCLPACLRACLPACLPACVRACAAQNAFRTSAIVHGVGARTLSGSGDKGKAAEERARQMLLNYENSVTGAVKEIDLLEAEAAAAAAGSKL